MSRVLGPVPDFSDSFGKKLNRIRNICLNTIEKSNNVNMGVYYLSHDIWEDNINRLFEQQTVVISMNIIWRRFMVFAI